MKTFILKYYLTNIDGSTQTEEPTETYMAEGFDTHEDAFNNYTPLFFEKYGEVNHKALAEEVTSS